MTSPRTTPTRDKGEMWGVAHVDPGGVHVIRYRNQDDAERRLRDCREDDADCYLVRAVVLWERVDG